MTSKEELLKLRITGQTRSPGRQKPSVWDKLCMRMGWEVHGITHRVKMQIFEDGDLVFVMGVHNGEPYVLKDTASLFPSDQIVTQLRMLHNE